MTPRLALSAQLLVLQRPWWHQVQQSQRRSIRRGDRRRRGLPVHDAREIIRVVQPERVADLVSQNATHDCGRQRAARAVVIRDRHASLRDQKGARLHSLGHADALAVFRTKRSRQRIVRSAEDES